MTDRLLDGDLLSQLEERWRSQGAAIADRLRPGLSSIEIDEVTAGSGLTLPTEAKTWWGWHDGAADLASGAGQLGPGFFFLPLSAALDERQDQLARASQIASGM